MTDRRFWLTHALLPGALLLLGYGAVYFSGLDLWVLDHIYDPAAGGFPARKAFWASTVLHDGGRWLIKAIGVVALGVWAASFRIGALLRYRRAAGYVVLCLALGPGLIALAKSTSPVECPWGLSRYGGDAPYVKAFQAHPESLPPGRCFPAGHSSGAFALMAFYFVLRGSRPRAARRALAGAIAAGVLFGTTQWLRGAHFPSHDLATAFICWNICLALYPLCLSPRAQTQGAAAPDNAPGPASPA